MPTLIDTREAFRRLREEGGFTNEQADAIVDLFRDADEEVATRSDIKELQSEMKAMKNELGQKIEEKHAATVRTVVMTMGVMTAVLAVFVTLAIFFLG